MRSPVIATSARSSPSGVTTVPRRMARSTALVAVLFEAREPIRLILFGQRFDKVVDVPVHTPFEVGEVVTEAPIGEPVLGEVVGAHLFGALAAADLRVARQGLARLALLG